MKTLKETHLLILGLLAIMASTMFSCKRNGDEVNTIALAQQHADSAAKFYQTLGGTSWKIFSETGTPAQNGRTNVNIDSCNLFVVYRFSTPNLNQVFFQGNVIIDYLGSFCHGSARPTNPTNTQYTFDINPNILSFPDNGFDTQTNNYNILKLTRDSLVLQATKSGYSYIKTYLAEK